MISVKSLYFKYPGNSMDTLAGINVEIQAGEIFGFLGPSGAGKSTTQKILIGILRHFRGSVLVNTHDLTSISQSFYESLGVAFETPNLYTKFTARENLSFFARFYAGKTRDPLELLKMVDLADAADTPVSDFSKGMKVRLNVCRSLINYPKLLFLDEPTSGLDPVNLRKILELVRQEQSRGATVCLTTHDMHVAEQLCDRVAFIVDGQIKLIDSPRQLKLNHGTRMIDVETRARGQLEKHEFPMDKLHANEAFQTLLKNGHLETLHSREATLEDVFVKTTGRTLR